MKEMWKNVVGYESRYLVSNTGRVKSLYGKWGKRRDYIMKCGVHKSTGYPRVCLMFKGKEDNQHVHTLVLAAFDKPRPDGLVTNHKDGNKQNNHIDNLEYVTYGENNKHAREILGLPIGDKGERNGQSKLKETDVVKIIELLEDGLSCNEIADLYPVTDGTIWKIKLGMSWQHITGLKYEKCRVK